MIIAHCVGFASMIIAYCVGFASMIKGCYYWSVVASCGEQSADTK